jgi:hypothetical protein
MSDNTVLLNNRKLKTVINSSLSESSIKVGILLKEAKQRLHTIKRARGCNCKKGPQRSIVYQDVMTQLKSMDAADLESLKQHLNATTLIIGTRHV